MHTTPGGWTLSDNFPALSADPVARDAFAKKCADILAYHDFDGVDIDWEVSFLPNVIILLFIHFAKKRILGAIIFIAVVP